MTLAAVSDAGPLLHLAELKSLELLSAFDTILIPETVDEELERGGVPDAIFDLSYELVEADEERVESEELDAGERAAVSITKARTFVLLKDDFDAWEAVSSVGVNVHGSLGVIALGSTAE